MLSVRRRAAQAFEKGQIGGRGAEFLAHLYGSMAQRRLARAHSFSTPARVIGVGGSTLGGSWKTPVSIALATALRQGGTPVCFLAHGYGGRVRSAREVRLDDDPRIVGDEALLAARHLSPWSPGTGRVVVDPAGVWVGKFNSGETIVVDGSLAPAGAASFRLLTLDSVQPWGAGACPPCGDMRAPAAALLASADAVVSVVDALAPARALESEIDEWFRATFDLNLPASLSSPAVNIALVTMVARPQRFVDALVRRGFTLGAVLALPDHGGPTAAAATTNWLRRVRAPFDLIVTTEKCACWLPSSLLGRPVVPVRCDVTLPGVLLTRIRQRLGLEKNSPRRVGGDRSLGTMQRVTSPQPFSRDERQLTALAALGNAPTAFSRSYPGDSDQRQPVHTMYGGAHRFRSDVATGIGQRALEALNVFAPTPEALVHAMGFEPRDALSPHVVETLYTRVRDKLRTQPVEDLRIDFEDGYGTRSDDEEDAHACAAAKEMAAGLAAGTLPPFVGLRIKALEGPSIVRSLRTLGLFLTNLAEATGGLLPPNFVVTLPKVTAAAQVAFLSDELARFEGAFGWPPQGLRLEFLVETTTALFDAHGVCPLLSWLAAAPGRIRGVHFGAYDYLTSCGIVAAEQRLTHPACDFARNVLQVAYAGTGVWLADGVTTLLPVGPHRATEGGRPLSPAQHSENEAAVQGGWRVHARNIRHGLAAGFYQGWDVHPAQLPARYAATYGFFLAALPDAQARLRNFRASAAQAVRTGAAFDDAASARGIEHFFAQGRRCGALTAADELPTDIS